MLSKTPLTLLTLHRFRCSEHRKVISAMYLLLSPNGTFKMNRIGLLCFHYDALVIRNNITEDRSITTFIIDFSSHWPGGKKSIPWSHYWNFALDNKIAHLQPGYAFHGKCFSGTTVNKYFLLCKVDGALKRTGAFYGLGLTMYAMKTYYWLPFTCVAFA